MDVDTFFPRCYQLSSEEDRDCFIGSSWVHGVGWGDAAFTHPAEWFLQMTTDGQQL